MPGESEIWLDASPFHTVDRDNLEWFEQFREPDQIDFAKAVIIGDFGPGSDAPIVIDFSNEPARVKALQITFTSTGVVYGVADPAVTGSP
jgi:hypothetical protein